MGFVWEEVCVCTHERERAGVGASYLSSLSLSCLLSTERKQEVAPVSAGTGERGSGGQYREFGRVKGVSGDSPPKWGMRGVACIQGQLYEIPCVWFNALLS